MSAGPDLRGFIPDITKLGLPFTAVTVDDATEPMFQQQIEAGKFYIVEGTIGGVATDNSQFIAVSFQLGVKLNNLGDAEIVAESTPYKMRSQNVIDVLYLLTGIDGNTLSVSVKGFLGTTMNWSGTIKVNATDL